MAGLKNPLAGKQVSSPVSTGGGGILFQARTQALYVANMLTGLPTAPGVAGGRVLSVRFEARYTGAHTDDIYCEVEAPSSERWRCFVQCKRKFDVIESDSTFADAYQAAWRDWLDQGPFRRSRDTLSIASTAPASTSLDAAREVCQLARASDDLADFLKKLKAPGLKAKRVPEAWRVFCELSKPMLDTAYSDDQVLAFTKRLRLDVHDLGSDDTQEMVMLGASLGAWCSQPEKGELFRAALTEYCLEMGQKPGTATAASWRTSAPAALQEAFDAGIAGATGATAGWVKLVARAEHQLGLVGTALPNGVHLDRPTVQEELLTRAAEHPLVVVTGDAGVGKSGAIATAARGLAAGNPILFFRADELDYPSLDASLVATGVTSGVLVLNAAFQAHERVVLVIDSLEKALEFEKRGALEELLGLAAKHKSVRVVITVRSYALAALLANFLYTSSFGLVEVEPLSDEELSTALAASNFAAGEQKSEQLRKVLRIPFYLKLAIARRTSAGALPTLTAGELRKFLWEEAVSPSASKAGLAQRRRLVFDTTCFTRTERLTQFVDPPSDAEAVESLKRDGILVADGHGRVAPGHDVLEDWSLYFRVEREVARAEQDWPALFDALGTHSGLRRAFRSWTSDQADLGNKDALALLAHCVTSPEVPALWRDEAFIGLLRSDAAERLLRIFEPELVKNDFTLLRRVTHILRVACKGPAKTHGAPFDDSELAKEAHIRAAMTTPVGESWTHVVSMVDKHKSSFAPGTWSWVAALLEDAVKACTWYAPTSLSKAIHNVAAYYVHSFDEAWSRNDGGLHKRFFTLFIAGVANDPERVRDHLNALIARVRAARARRRDFQAEERLSYTLTFLNSVAPAVYIPLSLWGALLALHVSGENEDEEDDDFRSSDWRRGASFGFKDQGVSPFFPASCMSGPFRHLLTYHPQMAVRFIVTLANNAAAHFMGFTENRVVVIPPEQSPNGREHLHSEELWLSYRGLAVSDDLLASALMALEERLLSDALAEPARATERLDWLLENGTSTLTTAVAASVVAAHPHAFTAQFLRLARCPDFFLADRRRSAGERMSLAVLGGQDGLDKYRQKERTDSNNLPHRQLDLESVALKLQLEGKCRDEVFAALDEHIRKLESQPASERDDVWRVALKRMDLRGLKLGPPVGTGSYRILEIADLDPDLAAKSKVAEERMAHANRRARLQLWAASAAGRREKDDEPLFQDARAVLTALHQVHEHESEGEAEIYSGFDQQVAAGLALEMFGQDPVSDAWALEQVSADCVANLHVARDVWVAVARALVRLLAVRRDDVGIRKSIANVAFHRDREVRSALAEAVNEFHSELTDNVVSALALSLGRYAELVGNARSRPWPKRDGAYRAARRLARWEMLKRLAGVTVAEPALTGTPTHVRDWVNAVRAARKLAAWDWRLRTLHGLTNLAAEAENSRPGARDVDYGSRRLIGRLFASELLRTDDEGARALSRLKGLITTSPEFSAEVLQDVLLAVDGDQYKGARRLWAVWDGAASVAFAAPSLRSGHAYHLEKVVRQLLFVDVPWNEGLHHLALFEERPTYLTDCLLQVGDTHVGLAGCLEVMTTVARQSSIPSALPALRDAVVKHGASAFTPMNTQWNAELICRVAVHRHREQLMKSKPLREAVLDVLTVLVDAGSSIGFQLRDYLATASAKL
jgi:hypothetical protein